MSIATKELNSQLTTLKKRIDNHVTAYLANVEEDLKLLIQNLKDDYTSTDSGKVEILPASLDFQFLTGKNSLLARINAFYDEDIPDCEFASSYELSESLEEIENQMENHLREDGEEDLKYIADQLKLSYERLSMGVTSEIDTILKLTNELTERHS